MFQRQRMILKGCVTVSHGRMAGVAGFCRKTEVRHAQVPQVESLQLYFPLCTTLRLSCMQRQQQEESQACSDKQEKLQ